MARPSFSDKTGGKKKIKLTQQHFDELLKCGKDPAYFIKKYVYIQHPKRGRIKFDLFPFQEDCLKDFQEFRFNIVLKSRQLGLSTVTSAYALWVALFQEDANILFVATKLDTAKNMVQKIRVMFQMLPTWITEALDISEPESDSMKQLKLSNGSKIAAIPTGVDAGRGESVTLLAVDEAAHIDDFERLWTGLFPTLSQDGNAIVFSSPNGKGNYFYDVWSVADTHDYIDGRPGFHGKTTGANDFHAIKLPWMVHPERDQNWYDKETKPMSDSAIAQELMCDFLSSGKTYITAITIENLRGMVKYPKDVQSPHGSDSDALWIWEPPTLGKQYIVGSDVARGDADDFSTAYVIDIETSTAVAEFMSKVPTDVFGSILADIGSLYNNALLAVESNTFGVAVLNKLKSLEYKNLYYSPELKEKMMWMTEEDKEKQTPGFAITSKNRELILDNLEQVLRMGAIQIFSSRFVEQIQTFVWNGKRGQAMKNKNDDLIMALVVALQMYKPLELGVNYTGHKSSTKGSDWAKAFLASVSNGGQKPAQPQKPSQTIVAWQQRPSELTDSQKKVNEQQKLAAREENKRKMIERMGGTEAWQLHQWLKSEFGM